MNYAQAILAYILWGIFPLYWKLLPNVPSFEVICHRIVWSLLTLVICIQFTKQWPHIRAVFNEPKRLWMCFLASLFICLNWLLFIWAVQHNYVIETSLGYFINPMLNVVMGVVFFREQLHRIQWIAVLIALVGVVIMSRMGDFPGIALSLAFSFSFYSVVKKLTTMPAVAGLGMETAFLAPVSLAALVYFANVDPSVETRGWATWMLLAIGGPVTTLPLLLFAASAKSVPMVAMGMLQYISPSIQLVLGVALFDERVSQGRIIGFVLVWIALILFTVFTILNSRPSYPISASKE